MVDLKLFKGFTALRTPACQFLYPGPFKIVHLRQPIAYVDCWAFGDQFHVLLIGHHVCMYVGGAIYLNCLAVMYAGFGYSGEHTNLITEKCSVGNKVVMYTF